MIDHLENNSNSLSLFPYRTRLRGKGPIWWPHVQSEANRRSDGSCPSSRRRFDCRATSSTPDEEDRICNEISIKSIQIRSIPLAPRELQAQNRSQTRPRSRSEPNSSSNRSIGFDLLGLIADKTAINDGHRRCSLSRSRNGGDLPPVSCVRSGAMVCSIQSRSVHERSKPPSGAAEKGQEEDTASPSVESAVVVVAAV